MTPLDQQRTLVARTRELLEIDRNSLLFPIAKARRVEFVFLAGGRPRRFDRLRPGDWWRRAEIGRGLEMFRAFHGPKMSIADHHAKR